MFGFLKKKKEGTPSYDNLDVPPPPPPLFEQKDIPMPFSPPPPMENNEIESAPRPIDIPMPEEMGKPMLPDFMDEGPDTQIPDAERAGTPPPMDSQSPLMPPLPEHEEDVSVPMPQLDVPLPPPRPPMPVSARVLPPPPRPPLPRAPLPRPSVPMPPVANGESLFVNVEEYKAIVDSISGARNGIKNCEDALFRLTELDARHEAEMAKWHRTIEDVQRKFVFIDTKLFEGR